MGLLLALVAVALAFVAGRAIGAAGSGSPLALLRAPPEREHEGERLVRERLSRLAPGVHLLNNVTLPVRPPARPGDVPDTTQIDHVLVTPGGVFVIETKHYGGWLFGTASDAEWTQTFPNGRKSCFQNPLRQNYQHVVTIRRILNFIPPEVVVSCVVFTGEASFRTGRPAGVFDLPDLSLYIAGHPLRLSPEQIDRAIGCLERWRYAISAQTDVEHVASLNRRHGRHKS